MGRSLLASFASPVALLAAVLAVACGGAAFAANPAAGQSQLVPSAVPPWARSGADKPALPAAMPQGRDTAARPPAHSAAGAQSAAPASGSTEPPSAIPAADAGGSSQPLLAVRKWGLSASLQHEPNGTLTIDAVAGRPLYLWLTVEGGEPAVDRLRETGRLVVKVHWSRDDAASGPSAPDLTTELTIGRPGLAATLAGEVQKQGHFEWHLWTRKNALSRGKWTMTLTYPDGAPVQCGVQQPQPCRLSIDVG